MLSADIDKIVPDKIVIEVLCRHPVKAVNKLLESTMIVIDSRNTMSAVAPFPRRNLYIAHSRPVTMLKSKIE